MGDFIALQYKGKTWGIYGKKCECFIALGNKKEIQKRIKKLNNKGDKKNGKFENVC